MDNDQQIRTSAIINTLVAQRNDALNSLANAAAEVEILGRKVMELEAKLAAQQEK